MLNNNNTGSAVEQTLSADRVHSELNIAAKWAGFPESEIYYAVDSSIHKLWRFCTRWDVMLTYIVHKTCQELDSQGGLVHVFPPLAFWILNAGIAR